MRQTSHGSATTTPAIRAAIQQSDAPLKELAAKYGLNRKTVAKWRKRDFVYDAPMGPKDPRSTVLRAEDEVTAVTFRKMTLLPLDDCLYTLQAVMPYLTRSALHRCFQRHGVSRLPDVADKKIGKNAFGRDALGYVRVAIDEYYTEEGRLHHMVAIDRASRYAFARVVGGATGADVAKFLTDLVETVPYQIHTVLTDDAVPFADPPETGNDATAKSPEHPFAEACRAHGIEHRLTKPAYPSADHRRERGEPAGRRAAIKRYKTYKEFEVALAAFVHAVNFSKRLKNLDGLTPYQLICRANGKQAEI